MVDKKTSDETPRTVDGSEEIRLAADGENWKSTLESMFLALGVMTFDQAPPAKGTLAATEGSDTILFVYYDPAWAPDDLGSALKAWYKADTGVYKDEGVTLASNNDPVNQWNDQSGNGAHLSTLSGGIGEPKYLATGVNGYPTLQFTTTGVLDGDFIGTASDAVAIGNGSPVSCFCVMNLHNHFDYGNIVGYGDERGSWNVPSGIAILKTSQVPSPEYISAWYKSVDLGSRPSITLDTNVRVGAVASATTYECFVNNVGAGTVGIVNELESPGGLAIGGLEYSNPGMLLSEVVFTNTALTAGERHTLDCYFRAKYDLFPWS